MTSKLGVSLAGIDANCNLDAIAAVIAQLQADVVPPGGEPLPTYLANNAVFNVMDEPYGAVGDGVHDDSGAIQAAINAAAAVGGGVVLLPIPAVTFKTGTTTLLMKKGVTLQGRGANVSTITYSGTGDGLKFAGTINVQNIAKTSVRDLGIIGTNNANVAGAGYCDVGGTFVHLFNVHIQGFGYGVIFDQTELGDIDLCNIELQQTGAIWLVNGSDHTPGADVAFTNRISIRRSQINESNTVMGIIDDGGNAHLFESNNYNGCLTQVRVAAGIGHAIIGGEWEGSAQALLVYTNTTFNSATGVGNSEACVLIAPLMVQSNAAGVGCVNIVGVNALTVIGGHFGSLNGSTKITGGGSVPGFLTLIGCKVQNAGALIDNLGLENSINLSGTPNNDVALPQTNAIYGAMEFIRIFGETADFTITGFVADYPGRLIQIFNPSAHVMTIANANAGSAAANRITSSTGADVTIQAKGSIVLRYAHDIPGWIVVSTS